MRVLFLILLLVGSMQAEQLFKLEQTHLDELRKARVSWNGAEVGAPCLEPGREYSEDTLKALQIVLLHGKLKPGAYDYQKPTGGEMEYSFFVESLPESQVKFQFREEHLTLFKHFYIDWEEDFFDNRFPSNDPKRPYGDFTYYELEMAKHLKLPVKRDEEGMVVITDEQEEKLSKLHHTTQAALAVFLKNCELELGTYVSDDYANWERQ